MTPWREYKKTKSYPALDKDISVDVAIIGGGMAGVLNAYQLSRTGLKVALVEKSELGSFATMDTTAFITAVIDSSFSQIASIFSPQVARIVWESGQEAIEAFDKIIDDEDIECEFKRSPNYLFASSRKQFKELEKEYALYKRLKTGAVLQREPLKPGFPSYGHIQVPDQAKFHPTKFLYALAEKARKQGALIFENTEAIDIKENGEFIVETKRGNIRAKNVVIATYKPITNKKTHLKKAMYRSYVFEVEVPKGVFQEALYEDQSNPYYYFRIDSGDERDRMIIGGEDHKDIFGEGLAKESFQALGEFLDKIMGKHRYWIMKKWSEPILEPTDGLPLIGEIAPNFYVATAFSGNGMTYSMISSLLIRDLILKKKNPWTKTYNPKRSLLHPKRLGSKAKDYVEEFFSGAIKNLLS